MVSLLAVSVVYRVNSKTIKLVKNVERIYIGNLKVWQESSGDLSVVRIDIGDLSVWQESTLVI
jgi:hypothetical protein